MSTESQSAPSALPLPPGSRGLPLLGETLEFVMSPPAFSAKRRAKYGNVFMTHLLGAPTVVMIGHAANHWVFSGEEKFLQNRWTYGVRQILGRDSLSQINGERHRERRRMFAPQFKYESMSHFVPAIEQLAQTHLTRWAAQGGTLTVETAMRQLAFEIIMHFIFSEDVDKLDQQFLTRQFTDFAGGLFTPLPIDLPFLPFGKALRAKQAIIDYLTPLIRERRQSGRTPNDVLNALMTARDSAGVGLSDETIVHEIQLLLFAGHDTTVTSTTNILLLLAQYPDVLRRAREEQDALSEADRAMTLDNLKKLPYLDAVIHESMRIIPPIGGMFRITTQEIEYGGYRIPKGTVINLQPRGTHMDESVWSEPQAFRPDRWIEGEQKRPAFSHIPFGGGPRLCLGQNFALVEMKIILSHLLRDYQWTLLPDQDLRYRALPFPLPKSGVLVHFGTR